MRLLRSVLALAGLAAAGAFHAPAIKMEVKAGETRCLSDSVRVVEDTIFSYRYVASGEKADVPSKVKVTIRDPNGKQHHADLTENMEQYIIPKGGRGGECRLCFKNFGRKGTSTIVEVEEPNVMFEHGPRSETAPHLGPVELLNRAKEVSKSLKQQLEEGAKLEFERVSNEKVLRSNINKVAAFTILVLLSVSGLQLAVLNKFFRSKKLI